MTTAQNGADANHLAELRALMAAAPSPAAAAQAAMDYLHQRREDYHWVGIYHLRGDTLELGAYQGPTTDHTRIPVGRGVCGTAVAANANQIVADVAQASNYLACNLETQSEIVVLLRDPASGRILGQIDVDGRRLNQFGAEDERFLTAVGDLLVAAECLA